MDVLEKISVLNVKGVKMAIKSKDEILNSLKEILKEDTSDEAIAIIEDVTDTIDDFSAKISDDTDWKKKYEDNDHEWRQKYRDRFFNHSQNDEPEDEAKLLEPEEVLEKTKFEELFSEKGD